jgi:hypothetical protein
MDWCDLPWHERRGKKVDNYPSRVSKRSVTGMLQRSNSCYSLLQQRGFVKALEWFTKLYMLNKLTQGHCAYTLTHD